MEKEQVIGKLDELKGKAKQGIGKVADDPRMQEEGIIDEVKGHVKLAVGDLKGTVKHADKKAGFDVNDK